MEANDCPPSVFTLGHLALMLIRYLYDEKVMALPVGLMLFSVLMFLALFLFFIEALPS